MTLVQTFFYASWIANAVVVGLVWLIRLVFVGRSSKTKFRLSPNSYDGPPDPAPKLSVIVAAKDEQDNIETCVSTLLSQDYPDFELIAVDDRSTDQTPAILAKLADTAKGKLCVHTVKELPDGWFGKNNAMRVGIEASQGDWLCLTDADCRQISNSTLSMALRDAEESGADFLSITPILDTITTWEKITQPVCALALIVWFLPERVNDPNKRTAYANGAFMLIKRSCYDAIGGHECVRTDVNEDIQLARIAKRAGYRLRVLENEGLYRTRMYRTVRESWRGWSRIFYGSLTTPHRISIAMGSLFTFALAPWLNLIVALVMLAIAPADHTQRWFYGVLAWGFATLACQIAVWPFYRVIKMNPAWSLTYFFGACITFAMQCSAMLKAIGATNTTWRGTTYRGSERIETVVNQSDAANKQMSTTEPDVENDDTTASSLEENAGSA